MPRFQKGCSKSKNAYSFPRGKSNPNQRTDVREKIRKSKIGKKNGMWVGGITNDTNGYRMIKLRPATELDDGYEKLKNNQFILKKNFKYEV